MYGCALDTFKEDTDEWFSNNLLKYSVFRNSTK